MDTASRSKEGESCGHERSVIATDNSSIIRYGLGIPLSQALDSALLGPSGPAHMWHAAVRVLDYSYGATETDRQGHLVHREALFEPPHRGGIRPAKGVDALP